MKNELPFALKTESKIIEFLNTKDFTSFGETKVAVSEPLFEAIPPVIRFADYEALKVKTIIFKLRNKDSVSRRVKIVQPETNLFKISPMNENDSEASNFFSVGNKIAPGLEISFIVKFSPETKSDYSHDLVIVTEREKFVVPIFAIGKKALLEFPDIINFGNECPVKYSSEKAVILHNRGEKSTKWELRLPENFTASKVEGVLDAFSTEQLLVRFYPLQKRNYDVRGSLLYDGEEAEFVLRGNAINGEVYLSQDRVSIDETYISLESKQTFKILNRSSVKIDFEWRAFSSEREEQEKKEFLLNQLNVEEDEKRRIINEMIDLEDNIDNLDDMHMGMNGMQHAQSLADFSENEKALVAKKRRRAELMLERKYKGIRKAVDEDRLAFEDEIFSIQPISGSIWPNSEMTITVVFKPRSALKYCNTAYCNISCSDERLLLNLEGEGLGPKAFLSTNVLSIGDIFVNDRQTFNIYIENRGEIPANFFLVINPTDTSRVIEFDIENGILAVGQRMNITLTFQHHRVGEFQEMFRWRLEGSTEILTLLVRGHVRTPHFEFDRKSIDFKKISYQFEEIQELQLTNTSTVAFVFTLRVPQDGKGSNKEFEIDPASDTIMPAQTKTVLVKFVPHYRKIYNVALVIDVEGIGKDMKSIPITAEVEVPKVRLASNLLDFGEIFLRYSQTKEIELINESKLYARFLVHPINPKFNVFGKISTDLERGQIPPESSVKLGVSLTTCCLKDFHLELIIEIISDASEQHLIKIKGHSKGPTVDITPKEIDFGDKEVLQKHIRKVTLTNNSIIEADFYAFTKNKTSIFKPLQRHYVLKPGQAFDVEVLCLPDDASKFSDTLFFVIKEGVDKEVKLRARGIGSTVVCKDITTVDFGTMFTHRTQMEEVFIENKGRKTQTLKWTRKIDSKNKGTTSVVPKLKEKAGSSQTLVTSNPGTEPGSVFQIFPETVTLPPKTGLHFQFKAFSAEIGKISEQFILTTTAGNERKTNTLFVSTFEGEFTKPTLVFSKKTLNFRYVWEKNVEPVTLSQDLEITCASPLPVVFSLYIDTPFTVTPDNLSMAPGKKAIVRVDFDPTQKKDRISGNITDKLWIKHQKHPKNENFPVTAEFCYPNLVLDTDKINFGAVMNDTIKKCSLVMKNISVMPVEYCWYFTDGSPRDENDKEPINEVFDILPLRGVIESGNDEKVEFSYFAISNRVFELTALCKIDGGPDYPTHISAEASNVAYNLSLSKKGRTIDIGETFLATKVVQDFEIENTSKVLFDYSIRLDLSLPRAKLMTEFITFSPAKGTLSGGEKARIRLSMAPGFPGEMHQALVIQIAHFEPERVLIRGFGLFPSLRLATKRKVDVDLLKIYQHVNSQIISRGSQIHENESKDYSLWQGALQEEVMHGQNTLADPDEEENKERARINESVFYEMRDDMFVEMERLMIKNYIKQNHIRLHSGNDKKSSINHSAKSQIKKAHSVTILPDDQSSKSRFMKGDYKFFEELVLANYVLNLGLIVAGSKSTSSLRIENIGKCHSSFSIDMKNFKTMGLSISCTKVHKLPHTANNNSITLQVTLQTKKNHKPGRAVFQVPIIVENGGRYILEVVAQVTVPELQLSASEIDFGKVLLGYSKKMYIRLENLKEINCEWTVSHQAKAKIMKKDDGGVAKFTLTPAFGSLLPGGKRTLEIMFEPTDGKHFDETLSFAFRDSNKKIDLICKGEGIAPLIEFIPANMVIPTCMPREVLFRRFTIRNNSDFDIGLIWTDCDGLIIEEEKLISEMPTNISRLKVRGPTEPFWQELKEDIEINRWNRATEIELAELEHKQVPDKDILRAEILSKMKEKPKRHQLPQRINLEKQDNILLFSKIESVDFKMANFLHENAFKCPINFGELLDWHIKRQTPIGIRLQQQKQDKLVELESIMQERNKKIKAKKPVPDFDKDEFLYISREEFKSLLEERISVPECAAGIVMYNMRTDLVSKETANEIILELLSKGNILAFKIKHPDDDIQEKDVQDKKKEILLYISEKLAEMKMSENQKNSVFRSLESENQFPEIQHDDLYIKPDKKQYQVSKILYMSNLTNLYYTILRHIPKPAFPDPSSLPLPSTVELQTLRKLPISRRQHRSNNFELLTMKTNSNEPIPDDQELNMSNYTKYLETNSTRWILKSHENIELVVKFRSDKIGNFNETFNFENFSTAFSGTPRTFQFTCKAVTQFPNISRNIVNIFQNRRKIRTKNMIVINEYVIPENVYDFGPLLLLDNKAMPKNDLVRKRYITTFRLTNSSPYPTFLTFVLQSENPEMGPASPPAQVSAPVFEIEPREVSLGIGETIEVQVKAFPKMLGLFKDTFICLVRDNPTPYIVNLRAEGILPAVNVNVTEINFDRILVNKKAMNHFEIKNMSLIDVRWTILNFKELAKEGFSVSKESGLLNIDQHINLDVSFLTVNQEKKRCVLEIEVEDAKGFGIKMKELKKILLIAEGFKVNVSFTGFKTEEQLMIDFGSTLVDFPLESTFGFKNEGIYPIKYQLEVSKPQNSQFFEIIPSSGELPAGGSANFNIKFLSKREVRFDGKQKDGGLLLKVFERNEIYNQMSILVNAEAQFSKFSIDPCKCLNFGPVSFSESKTKTFELINHGQFEISFELFEAGNIALQQEVQKRFESAKQEHLQLVIKNKGKLVPFRPPKPKGPEKLVIQQFSVSPCFGSIPVGGAQKFEVIFKGNGSNFYEARIGIETTNRNPTDLLGLFYNLAAESCVPSLEISNFRAIFEEQVVTQSLLATGVNLQSVVTSNIFSVDDNTFYFGSVVPTKNPDGITERIKIINTGKVFASVKFDVVKKNALFAFDIAPKQAKINPHEFIYVKLQFKPDIMAQYEGAFTAIIENGDPSLPTSRFGFDVKGEGSLPSLNILSEGLSNPLSSGEPLVDLGRVRIDKPKKGQVRLKNMGVIPASFQAFWISPPSFLKFISPPERTLMPLEVFPFQVEFLPKEIGKFESRIIFTTQLNNFEKNSVVIRGEGIDEMFSIEGIENDDNELDFGDILLTGPMPEYKEGSPILSKPEKIGKKSFFIRNNSTSTLRIEISKPEDLRFIELRPNRAHIPSKMTKKVTVIFLKTGQPLPPLLVKDLQIRGNPISLKTKTSMIQKLINWDDQKCTKRLITPSEYEWIKICTQMKKQLAEDRKINPKSKEPIYPLQPSTANEQATVELREAIDEPEFEIVTPRFFETKVKIMARVDVPKVSLETTTISFKPTKMFTSRVVNFKAFNNSAINVPFEWDFYNPATHNREGGPYSITPLNGSLPKNSFQEFMIRFSPAVYDPLPKRLLLMRFGTTLLASDVRLELEGEIERPICHFELPFVVSDFGEKLVEIESLGINTKVERRFYVLNPTAVGYEFLWVNGSSVQTQNQNLRCLTPKGVILPSKKFEMHFEFYPDANSPDKQDQVFTFLIKQFSLTESFIFRTKVRQPKVFFSTSKIDFGPLLLSGKTKEIVQLKNLDNVAYNFSFSKASLKEVGKDRQSSLRVSPLHGTIPPNSDLPITLTFCPKLEIDFNFNLQLVISQKKEPLSINVKGKGYKLHHQVKMNNCLLESTKTHDLDFGELFVHEPRKHLVEISNSGDFNIDFVLSKKPHSSVTVAPESGTVRKGEHVNIEAIFQSANPMTLESAFQLHIVSGPNYNFDLRGVSKLPLVEVFPKILDFGELTLTKGTASKTLFLEFTNFDKKPLSIECEMAKNDFLEVQLPFGQSLLPFDDNKENKLRVPVIFKPKSEQKSSSIILFYINGRHKIEISVKGEAINCLYELANAQEMLVDFGIVSLLSRQAKSVSVRNFSKAPLHLTFDVEEQLGKLAAQGLTLNTTSIIVPRRGTAAIDITFAPLQRQRQFTMPLKASPVDNPDPMDLCMITGACFAADVKLIEDAVNFGPVVANSYLTKKLQIINSGDLSAEYSWDLPVNILAFTISPLKGLIMPSEQLFFDITFSPKGIHEYKTSAKLIIKNSESPFVIQFNGKGIPTPASSTETVHFETSVRSQINKPVTLKNPTQNPWVLRPIITTDILDIVDFFTVAKTIEVPALGSIPLQISYLPLTSSPEIQSALLFIPLPDGSAITYQLQGRPLQPKPEDPIAISFKAKSHFSQNIQIVNWLQINQRFNVEYELVGGKHPSTEGLVINSASIIEVYPGLSQHFKLSIYALRKGNFGLNVLFRNKQNKEYLHYILNLTVDDSSILRAFELHSVVREPKSQTITIENPLNMPVLLATDKFVIESKDVILKTKTPFTIQPLSEFVIELIYRPLIVSKAIKSLVKINSTELGNFYYELILSSEKPSIIPTINFKTSLGNDHYKTFSFRNFIVKPITYTCKVERLTEGDNNNTGPSDFTTEGPTVAVQPSPDFNGNEVNMNIKFEPSFVGLSKAFLTVSNPEGGDYHAYLIGTSTSPLPKGPYKISSKGTNLDFKNTLYESKEFYLKIDNPNFVCTVKSPFKLDAKKTISLALVFRGTPENSTGRIIVETKDQIAWVYYLQGI
jgi:hydrocephalus-inducing protein